MTTIAKLEVVPLRKLWPHEERGFSSWLFSNLDGLAETLDITLLNPEREKPVGRFSLDLLAETEDGVQVIIENQLDTTDHAHLGKVLTYLANLEAKIAIWIVGDAREEHAEAIRWLNEFTPADMAFYLVKLSAYQIGDSHPAPHFEVVAGPTEIGRVIGQEKKDLATRHALQIKFWDQLLRRAKQRGVLWHAQLSPGKQMWIAAGAGVKAGVRLSYLIWKETESGVELYIDTGDEVDNKQIFDALISKRNEVESAFGAPLTWDRLDEKRASRVRFVMQGGGLRDGEEGWPRIQDAMIDAMDRLAKAVKPVLSKGPQ